MTDTDANESNPDASADTAPRLSIAAQYIKDQSFENPGAPASLQRGAKAPAINVGIDVQVRRGPEPSYEVELKISVEAVQEETTVFLAELLYGGVFQLFNIPAETLQPLLLVECPRLLFPFARRIIADMTRDGGYTPLMLDNIDFSQLYRQRMAQLQAQAEAEKKQ
ncbi:MAG: protein-export chaperone SecB [Alphaproteobacteria bacterium]|nr:protein-export chaperone SecB [Alphaproteobacteria bacterium]